MFFNYKPGNLPPLFPSLELLVRLALYCVCCACTDALASLLIRSLSTWLCNFWSLFRRFSKKRSVRFNESSTGFMLLPSFSRPPPMMVASYPFSCGGANPMSRGFRSTISMDCPKSAANLTCWALFEWSN